MIAVCFRCGQAKTAPSESCRACKVTPRSLDDLGVSYFLTERLIGSEKLAEASIAIRFQGARISLPLDVRNSVLEASIGREGIRKLQRKSFRKFALIAGVAAVLVAALHPWPHFQWASFRDTVAAYESYQDRFPNSDQAETVNERIRILSEDDVWKAALASRNVAQLRAYTKTYPDGKYLERAHAETVAATDRRWEEIAQTATRKEIAQFLRNFPETTKTDAARARDYAIVEDAWKKVSKERSVRALGQFINDYGDTARSKDAARRIQELYDDYDWVKEQDKLLYYQTFAKKFPNHPMREAIEKRIIDLEVQDIAAGDHGEMPRAEALTYGGTSSVLDVENKTGYVLTVRYSGPDSKKLVIPVGATRSISLSPGNYRVGASVDAAHVTNYYGSDTLRGGTYSSSFYISTSTLGVPDFTPDYFPSGR
jgi:nicotinamide mononucleotide adenylyltransferase